MLRLHFSSAGGENRHKRDKIRWEGITGCCVLSFGIIHTLVCNKQLEFINAGWCMNDKASTHYNAIIDQMSIGLQFVEQTFVPEARPRIGWHIAPFGHSSVQASLFAIWSDWKLCQ